MLITELSINAQTYSFNDRSRHLLEYFYTYVAWVKEETRTEIICPRLVVPLHDNTYIIEDDRQDMSQFCRQTHSSVCVQSPEWLVRPAIAVLIRTQYQEELDGVYKRLRLKMLPSLSSDHEWLFCKLFEIYMSFKNKGQDDGGLTWVEYKSLHYVHAVASMKDNVKSVTAT